MKRSPLAPEKFPDIPSISGVRLACAATGVKYKDRLDLLLAVVEPNAVAAGVFTCSKTAGAPVEWSQAVLGKHQGRALIVNAGNSNAFTGKVGMSHTQAMANAVSKALDCNDHDVFVASTGVIGEPLPCDRITESVPRLFSDLGTATWQEAASAIVTTDTFNKGAYREVDLGGKTVKMAGIAKGSGMIAPDMATMLAFIFTDAKIEQKLLQSLLFDGSNKTFNCITVDSDTSTSDTLLAFATGDSGVVIDENNNGVLGGFKACFDDLLEDLALQIVRDGEGASKLITIDVSGAENAQAARTIGLSIANSPLVKTAIAGEDANWGRIVMAVGKSGEMADRDRLKISIGGVLITDRGQRVEDYDEAEVANHLKGQEISIEVELGLSEGKARVWGCDLTHEYISINADYRS
jgi:glutamate N-acetyltransferase/amino-acid N-acetyltransferase